MKRNTIKLKLMSAFLVAELFLVPLATTGLKVQAFESNESSNVCDDYEYANTSEGVALLRYRGDSEDVVIPEEINGKKVNMISSDLFEGKKEQIKSVTLSSLGGYYLGIFDGLVNLENIYVDKDNAIYTSIDGVLYDKEKVMIYRYPAGRKDKDYTIIEGVKFIDRYAFCNAHLENIYIPNSIEKEMYMEIDENTKIIRAYSVSNITFHSDYEFKQGLPVDICVHGSNFTNNNIEGLVSNITISGEDGYTKELKEIKVDNDMKAKTSFIFPKNQKYKITANFTDKLGKCLNYSKDIDIVSDNFDYNMEIEPKTSCAINEEVNFTYNYGNNSLYSFSVEHNGKIQVLKDYSKDNSCKWTPTEGGIYSIYVHIKLSNGVTEKRTICGNYLVNYSEYSLNDMKNDMYNSIINNEVFNASTYIKGLDSLNKEAKEYLRYIANDICFDKDVIGSNDYLRVSYNNKIYRINLPYASDHIAIKNKIKDFKNKYISDDMSELEKELAVVKYISDTCNYDYDAVKWKDNGSLEYEDSDYGYKTSYTAYGALVNGLATCKGYAEAVKILLNSVGVECSVINSDSLNHVWNIVRIDGEYYQLDVTWIDTTSNGTDNDFFNFSNLDTRHDAEDISNLELYNKCTSNKYDNFIIANYNPTLRKIVRFNGDNFYTTDVFGNNYKNLVYKDDYIYYDSVKFSTGKVSTEYLIMQYDKYLYYCTKNNSGLSKYVIKKMNIETGDIEDVKNINSTCKLSIYNNKLILTYSNKSTEEIELYKLPQSNNGSTTTPSEDNNIKPSTSTVDDTSDNKHNNTCDNLSLSKYGFLFLTIGSLLFYLKKQKLRWN